MSRILTIMNYELTISNALEDFNKIEVIFMQISWRSFNGFVDLIQENSNVNEILDNLMDTSVIYIKSAVKAAINILHKLDIWDITYDDFCSMYHDNWFSLVDIYDELVDKCENDGYNYYYNSTSESKETFLESNIFWKYAHRLRNACLNVGRALYDLLIQLDICSDISMDPRQVQNTLANIHNWNWTKEQKIDKLIDCINLYPYNFGIYQELFELTDMYDISIANAASFFGFKEELKDYYEDIFNETWKNVSKYLSSNFTLHGIKYFEDYLISIKIMTPNRNWNVEFIETFNIQELFEYIKRQYKKFKNEIL